MNTCCNMKEMEKLFRMYSPEELAASLDNVLFTATVGYLDPDGACPTEAVVNDVTNVRFLLESLRECCKPAE